MSEYWGRISASYMRYLKKKAKERDLVWELSAKYLWELYLAQDRLCALTGLPLYIETAQNARGDIIREYHTASLDRIENMCGYVEGNVQWVHKEINMLRRDLTVPDFIRWCSLVAQHARIADGERNTRGGV